MTATPPRRSALAALQAVRRGELLDRALAPELAALPPRDRPWTQELVYGTVRLRGRLDFLLALHVRRGLDALEPAVLDALRLGAYQLLEMGSVPAYAAVSQSVELARAHGGRGAGGLVNAVLKAVDRERDADAAAFPALARDPVGRLSTWGSHPRWLVERWVARLGTDGARDLVDANNRRPALCVTPVGVPAEHAATLLAQVGAAVRPVSWAPDALCLDGVGGELPALLDAAPVVVQDPAASLVARYAELPAGVVADLCAAPGGKALGLWRPERYVVALDLSRSRLGRLTDNLARVRRVLRRLGRAAPGMGVAVADARRPPLGSVAGVLVDAPCTGTGTLRRHPDGRWRLAPRDLDALVGLQRDILDAAAPLPGPGGVLVYATCSLEEEENEAQVDAFLERHPEFEEAPAASVPAEVLDARGRLSVWPQRHGFDGAFAARLVRRS